MDRATVAELFSAFGVVDVRRVFSGFGVYADDLCFALFLRGDFYLKADETTIPRFVEHGSEPFNYRTSVKTVSVKSWWRMPSRLYDEPDELAEWAREAVGVAARARLKKRPRKKRAKTARAPDKAAPRTAVRKRKAAARKPLRRRPDRAAPERRARR